MKRQLTEITGGIFAVLAGWYLTSGLREYEQDQSSITSLFFETSPNWNLVTGVFFAGITVGLAISVGISRMKKSTPSQSGV